MTIININFGEIANEAFHNLIGAPGFVRDNVVYTYDSDGNEVPAGITEEAFKTEMNRVREEHQYRNERANAYPDLKEQMDQLWHAMDADESKRLEPFYSTIKTVKDAFPKDGSNNSSLETTADGPQLIDNTDEAPPTDYVPPADSDGE